MGYLYRHQRQNRNEPTKAFPLPRPVTNLLNRSHRYWLPFQSGWSGSHLVTWDIIPSEPQPPSLQHSQHFSLWVSRELQPAEPKDYCQHCLLSHSFLCSKTNPTSVHGRHEHYLFYIWLIILPGSAGKKADDNENHKYNCWKKYLFFSRGILTDQKH